MNIAILNYMNKDKIKPSYYLREGDIILLTAKINRENDPFLHHAQAGFLSQTKAHATSKAITNASKECGLYFIKVVMNKKPMWKYTFKGFNKKYGNYLEMDLKQEMINGPGTSRMIENKLFYKSIREKNMKDYVVLYE